MREYPQSVPNLTAIGANLFELIKSGGLVVYPADDLRLAVSRTIALETPRGLRLAKEKTSHKIDVVIALAMAALHAVEQGSFEQVLVWPEFWPKVCGDRWSGEVDGGHIARGAEYSGNGGAGVYRDRGW
jgi:hypothetical protein